jgi:hypothetical protein
MICLLIVSIGKGELQQKISGGLTASRAIKAPSGRFLDRWNVRFVF